MATQKDKLIAEAMKLVERGQYDRAVKAYLKVVADDEKDVRTWLKIGDLYVKLSKNHEAAETYEKVARFYSDQGFYTKAIAVYKQILKLDPRMIEIHERLADLYKQMGILPDAMAQYEAVAAFHQREGNSRLALEALKQIVELDPQNVGSRIKLAELCSKEGMVREAIDAFAKAAEHLQEQGRDDDYMKVAERLLFHAPDNRPVSRQLARLYLERGDARRALPRLQVCFKADPRDVDTLALLADAFDALGQTTKMISVLRELARIHTENGDPEARDDVYRKILRRVPDDAEARAALHIEPPAPRAPISSPSLSPPVAPQAMPPAMPPVIPMARAVDEEPVAAAAMGSAALREEEPPRARVVTPPPIPGTAARRPTAPPEPHLPPEARTTLIDDQPIAARIAAVVPAPPSKTPDEDEIERVLAESEVFMKYGLHAKAIEHLRPIVEAAPAHLRARERLKSMLVKAGRIDEARAELAALIERGAGTPEEEAFRRELRELAPGGTASSAPAPMPEPAAPTDELDVDMGSLDAMSLAARLPNLDEDAGPPPPSLIDEQPTDGVGLEPLDADAPPAQPGDEASAGYDFDEFPVVVESHDVEYERSGADLAPAIVEDRFGADLDGLPPMGLPPDEEVAPLAAAAPAAEEVEETAAGAPRLALDPEQVDNFDFSGFEDVTTGVEPLDPDFGESPTPAPPPVEDQAPVELADTIGADLEDDLGEADFYLQQGMTDEARELLANLLARHPGHPMVLAKISDLAAADPAQAERLAPPAAANGASDEADGGYALDDEESDLVITLSAEAEPAPAEPAPAEPAPAKRKNVVEKGVNDDDFESHFDLGIAYKEMGLVDDAMAEFQLVMRDPARQVQCRQMLGLCCLAKNQTVDAIEHFKQGLYAEGISEQEQLALYYELGRAYERLSDAREAVYYYDRILKRDLGYRDVQRRATELRPASATPPAGFAPAPADEDSFAEGAMNAVNRK